MISVRGQDSMTFLQGLMTQDVNLLLQDKLRGAIFTNFLTVKGKLLFDAIVAKPLLANQSKDDMELWTSPLRTATSR